MCVFNPVPLYICVSVLVWGTFVRVVHICSSPYLYLVCVI